MREWIGGSKQGAPGFTLIELMVALALTVLTSLCLVEASRFCQRAYERVANRGEELQQIYSAQSFIRSALETACPGKQSSPTRGLQGSSSAIEFTARGPLSIAMGGMSRLRFEVVDASEGKRNLEVRVAPDYAPLPDGSASHSGSTEAVVTGIASVDWSYRGKEGDSQDVAGWVSSWNAPDELPRAVRLRVTFSDGDPRRWPDLIATTRVTDRADCIFDAVAQRCRH
jgi:prepilin-type N-terminal cleavage/methylation domain-containing protein